MNSRVKNLLRQVNPRPTFKWIEDGEKDRLVTKAVAMAMVVMTNAKAAKAAGLSWSKKVRWIPSAYELKVVDGKEMVIVTFKKYIKVYDNQEPRAHKPWECYTQLGKADTQGVFKEALKDAKARKTWEPFRALMVGFFEAVAKKCDDAMIARRRQQRKEQRWRQRWHKRLEKKAQQQRTMAARRALTAKFWSWMRDIAAELNKRVSWVFKVDVNGHITVDQETLDWARQSRWGIWSQMVDLIKEINSVHETEFSKFWIVSKLNVA